MATALLTAFAAGFVARALRLPALVGYLAAGFALHAAGFEPDATLDQIADLGVLILLFGIGLKLRVDMLRRPVVWASAGLFAVIGTATATGALLAIGALGIPLARDLPIEGALIVGFALSFSSTVFAVQALERDDGSGSLAGRVAIGVLVLQDVIAVVFIVVSEGRWPSWTAIPVVVGLVALRPVFHRVLDRSGHGEILVLLGFVMAVGVGAGSFAWAGLKPDLGALVAGVLLASHPRAAELANRLLDTKDLLLIAFFLSIGLAGAPPAWAWIIGAAVVALVPTRSSALFLLFTRFRLRSRTAFHASVTLSTFSEFGLIVAAAAAASGHIPSTWVSTIAVAVSLSFVVGSAGNAARYGLYRRLMPSLVRFERGPALFDDAVVDIGDPRVLIFGMGRIGTGAYAEFERRLGPIVTGVDRSPEVTDAHASAGRRVVRGDALDRDFWEQVHLHPGIDLVIAAMSNHQANVECLYRVKEFLPRAKTAATAMYPDQVADLRVLGVDVARNLYEEAGQALADDAATVLGLEP